MQTSKLVPLALGLGLAAMAIPQAASAAGFQTKVLDSSLTDSSLVNPWGISASPGGPFWVSNNGTGTSTLYSVNQTTDVTTKLNLVVTIPGNGSVTGQVFNNTANFDGDAFLFVSEDGTVSGWRGALGTAAETLQAGSAANVYKGSAFATLSSGSYLYAANFKTGIIDVLKDSAAVPNLSGSFTDPNLTSGYAPFNIQNLAGNLFVTYALQDATKSGDVAGVGHGFVDEFDTSGNYMRRIASGGGLDSPWGLALAPSSLGSFANDLLVGNFGDGHINAFDISGTGTPVSLGQLPGAGASPLTIDGLWSLTPGNNGSAGSSQKLYYTAGPNAETGGVLGVLVPVPEASPLITFGLLLTLGGIAAVRRTKKA